MTNTNKLLSKNEISKNKTISNLILKNEINRVGGKHKKRKSKKTIKQSSEYRVGGKHKKRQSKKLIS